MSGCLWFIFIPSSLFSHFPLFVPFCWGLSCVKEGHPLALSSSSSRCKRERERLPCLLSLRLQVERSVICASCKLFFLMFQVPVPDFLLYIWFLLGIKNLLWFGCYWNFHSNSKQMKNGIGTIAGCAFPLPPPPPSLPFFLAHTPYPFILNLLIPFLRFPLPCPHLSPPPSPPPPPPSFFPLLENIAGKRHVWGFRNRYLLLRKTRFCIHIKFTVHPY